jgi:hypothetical protein
MAFVAWSAGIATKNGDQAARTGRISIATVYAVFPDWAQIDLVAACWAAAEL